MSDAELEEKLTEMRCAGYSYEYLEGYKDAAQLFTVNEEG